MREASQVGFSVASSNQRRGRRGNCGGASAAACRWGWLRAELVAISAPSYGCTCVPAVFALRAERTATTFECLEQAPINGHSLGDCHRLLLLLLLASLMFAIGPLGGFDNLAKRAAASIMRMLLLLATNHYPVLMICRCRWHLPAVRGLLLLRNKIYLCVQLLRRNLLRWLIRRLGAVCQQPVHLVYIWRRRWRLDYIVVKFLEFFCNLQLVVPLLLLVYLEQLRHSARLASRRLFVCNCCRCHRRHRRRGRRSRSRRRRIGKFVLDYWRTIIAQIQFELLLSSCCCCCGFPLIACVMIMISLSHISSR